MYLHYHVNEIFYVLTSDALNFVVNTVVTSTVLCLLQNLMHQTLCWEFLSRKQTTALIFSKWLFFQISFVI